MNALLKLLLEVEAKVKTCEAELPNKLKKVDEGIEEHLSKCGDLNDTSRSIMIKHLERMREQNYSLARWELEAAIENVEMIKKQIKAHEEFVKKIPQIAEDMFKGFR